MVGLIVRQYAKYNVAPELALNSLELVATTGAPVDYTQFQNKNILLTCFASWCGPCNAEIAPMEAIRPTLEQHDFVMLQVSDEEMDKIITFQLKHPKGGMQYLKSLTPFENVGVHTYPTHFVFDKNGQLRFKQTNPLDWDDPETINELIKAVE